MTADLRALLGDRYVSTLRAAVLADNPDAIASAQAVGGKLGQLMYLSAVDRLDRVLTAVLPALLAERDALAAKVERVRALHRPAYNDATRTPICETCHGKEGVHECGCWSAEDYQPVCAVCNEGHKGVSVPWPCPTIRALDGGE